MITPAGYVPVSEISFWLTKAFGAKVSELKKGPMPDFLKSPEGPSILDGAFDGKWWGEKRREMLIDTLEAAMLEEDRSLYLHPSGLPVVKAGEHILLKINGPNRQPDLLFVNDEYRHARPTDIVKKWVHFTMPGDALGSDEEAQHNNEARRKLERRVKEMEANCYPADNRWVDEYAPLFAEAFKPPSEVSNIYSSGELLNACIAAWRGALGDLAGAPLVLKEEDAAAVKCALIDRLDKAFSNIVIRVAEGEARFKGDVPQQSKPSRYPAAQVKRKMIELLKRERKRLDGEKRLTVDEIYTDVTNAIPGVTKNFLNETKREIYRENPNLKLPAGRPAKTNDK